MPNFHNATDRSLNATDFVINANVISQGVAPLTTSDSTRLTTGTTTKARKTRRLFTPYRLSILAAAVIGPMLLTGCGQSGNLYHVKDAPSNTDFILYKGNKTADAKATVDYDPKQVERAAAEDPANY